MKASRNAPARRLIVAEPPAEYRVRPPLVIDISVIAAFLFNEPARDQADAWMQGRQLFAPQLLDYELASVAVKKLHHGLAVDSALRSYESADIQLLDTDSSALVALADRYQLSVYDAAYLWLAAELKAPLATFDGRLGEAAKVHLATLA